MRRAWTSCGGSAPALRGGAALALLLAAIHGCVELPERRGSDPDARDGGLALGSWGDGGARRPPTGAPYLGPQCESADPTSGGVIVAGDAGTFVSRADDAGSQLARGNGSAGDDAVDGAPSAAAVVRSAGQLVISELMTNPAALSDGDGEWLELFNPSPGASVALDGCALDDGAAMRKLADGVRVPPLGYVTLARSAQVGFLPTQLVSFSLGNADDSLALLCAGVAIDRVHYGAGFPLAAGASMSLDAAALDAIANDQASAWCLGSEPDGIGERGTPGAANPPCELEDAGVR